MVAQAFLFALLPFFQPLIDHYIEWRSSLLKLIRDEGGKSQLPLGLWSVCEKAESSLAPA